jgi:uncharacterized flavoprotein (TIGR03862 family)
MATASSNPAPEASHGLRATVIGAGPAGLMAAERLALGGVAVTVLDRMPSPARKFLMAGLGGLNITHDEPLDTLLTRYGASSSQFAAAITTFPPTALRAWCEALDQPVFTGSSGRVFPRAMKASPLLRAWLRRLDGMGVTLRTGHRWVGWQEDGRPLFDPSYDCAGPVVLAVGGASWPRLGSDGAWTGNLRDALQLGGIAPFRPANCGFITGWTPHMARHAGTPLKRIVVSFAGRTVPGEAVITETGIEGGPFYALSGPLRDAILAEGSATAIVDLRPDLPIDTLRRRLAAPRRAQSLSTFLRKAVELPPAAVTLLRECAGTPDDLASAIKALPLRLVGTSGLARAISTAGGLRWDALDGFMLRPGLAPSGVFAAGEMLDWEAPTGGYLLQGAMSTGYAAGEAALAWIKRKT